MVILGACLAPAVLCLRGLPETAGRDLLHVPVEARSAAGAGGGAAGPEPLPAP